MTKAIRKDIGNVSVTGSNGFPVQCLQFQWLAGIGDQDQRQA